VSPYTSSARSYDRKTMLITLWDKDPGHPLMKWYVKVSKFELAKWMLIPTTSPLHIQKILIQSTTNSLQIQAQNSSPKFAVDIIQLSIDGKQYSEQHCLAGSISEILSTVFSKTHND
jgi:hypothetical protein